MKDVTKWRFVKAVDLESKMSDKRILVGMSGGIDSTFTAKKLLDSGWQVEGAVLVMHDASPVFEARRAAEELGIVLHEIDCREAFREKVEMATVREYEKLRIPNPCVFCNSQIKFKYLAECARRLGIGKISTGHYVKVFKNPQNSRICLAAADDKKKDQSYFLWQVSQEDLAMFYSTLESEEKSDVVKKLVETTSLNLAGESQEICFIPNDDRISFLKEKMDSEMLEKLFAKGAFVDIHGKRVGEHNGLIHYTPGQRKGLGIALGQPAYVLSLDLDKNEVKVGFAQDNVCTGFAVSSLSFVSVPEFEGTISCKVRTRHRGQLFDALVKVEKGRAAVELITPDKTVSKGQSAVFYDDDQKVLFGGIID